MKSCIPWLKRGLLIGNFLLFSAFAAPPTILRSNPPSSPRHKNFQFKQTTGNMKDSIVVPFGSSLDYTLDNSVSWQIINTETEILYQEGAGHLKGILFSAPGNYELQVHEKMGHSEKECTHLHFPDKIHIDVRPFKMVFDLSTVDLSKNLKGNHPANGTTLTVDVIFSSWEHRTTVYNENLKTAGARTSITGKLKNGPILLQQGKNTLEFQLEGMASNNTYISIDFMDVNGQVQSYSFTNKII